MNYRQIETSREIRLWVTGIIGPVVIGVASVLAMNPQLMEDTKNFVKRKVSKLKK
jgi:hypothetical protein